MTLAHWIPNPGCRTLGENRESLRCRFWRNGPVCCWPGRSSAPPSGWKARAVPNHWSRLRARGTRGHDRTSKRRRSPQTESLPGSEYRRFYINIRSWNAPQPRKSLAPAFQAACLGSESCLGRQFSYRTLKPTAEISDVFAMPAGRTERVSQTNLDRLEITRPRAGLVKFRSRRVTEPAQRQE